ncbi:MAG: RNA ligase family protein [Candidatus Helarchaeota archaeon]
MKMINAQDFPKLESPFIRETINGQYVCTPKIVEKYRWIFNPDFVQAVEKIDGTNVSVICDGEKIVAIYNRKNHIPFFKKGYGYFYEGIQYAIDNNYFTPNSKGQFFGELCGPKINNNPLHLKQHVWYPFTRLRKKNTYKFWNNLDFTNKNDLELYDIVSNVFKELWSLEIRRRHGTKEFAEGIVFYHNQTGEMCKLRRDMFDWYKDKRH